jgi:hypothetical protein
LNSYRTSSIARQNQAASKPIPKKLKLKYLHGSVINEDSLLQETTTTGGGNGHPEPLARSSTADMNSVLEKCGSQTEPQQPVISADEKVPPQNVQVKPSLTGNGNGAATTNIKLNVDNSETTINHKQ